MRRIDGLEYSAIYIAENKPRGVATAMAMVVINRVPTTSGMKPNAGGSPVGAHFNPVKKSMTLTSRKNANVSKATDAKIPTVVKIATIEHAINTPMNIFSKALRALKFGATRESE